MIRSLELFSGTGGLALGLLDVPEYFEQNRPILESIMASVRFGEQAEREEGASPEDTEE